MVKLLMQLYLSKIWAVKARGIYVISFEKILNSKIKYFVT